MKIGTFILPLLMAMLAGRLEAASPGDTLDKNLQTEHWAFKAPVRHALPAVQNQSWVRNPIDAFVLARLEKEGVNPSPEADRPTLIRRLSFDLLGIPPAVDEVHTFCNDSREDAYERLVDRLLASPHFGERWGRYWLDLARYADSDGYEKDNPRPYAYLYRDWVIDAINDNLSFNQFTIEQLAGDLLLDATPRQKIATGFHRNTLTNKEGGVDQEEFRCKATVDRANTTATVWLGLTAGCAECHSHKYDPISQREYYQWFAFFNNVSEKELPVPKLNKHLKAEPHLAETKAQVVTENESFRKTHIHIRGDFLRPGEEVAPNAPAVLPPMKTHGGTLNRLDLAQWLFDPANPLTGRVAANRIWYHLFSRGLVASLDDFGKRGEKPSHPELLDWLAIEYPRLHWDRKALIKTIVTSSAYRQVSFTRPDLVDIDPNNLLLARQNRFRLEAEVIRDSALATSGLLTDSIGGPSIRPPLPADIAALGYANSVKWKESTGSDKYRRGMYIFFQRTVPYPMLTTFDAPDSNTTCTRRERSDTPLQALTLLNDSTFFECAQALAKRQMQRPAASPRERIADAFEECLSRRPAPEELARLEKLFATYSDLQRKTLASAAELDDLMPKIGDIELTAMIGVSRTILNLDEFLTRE